MHMHKCRWVRPHAANSHLEQFDICVEQVTFGDMDALEAQLMDELQDPCGDDCLPACACAGKGPL